MDVRTIDGTLAASPQISVDDLKALADAGYRAIISNRPDGESPDQPSAAEIADAAQAAGLEFRHIPVVPGAITDDDVAAFRSALDELPRPALGFCRTGTRTTTLWALANADRQAPDDLIESAKKAGYDLSALRPRLQAAG